MHIEVDDLVRLADCTLDELEDAGSRRLLEAWYTLLVHQTLEHVQCSVPYYRAFQEFLPAAEYRVLSDLRRYPLLRRVDLTDHHHRFLSDTEPASGAVSTSGTTGRRLLIYGNEAEQAALQAFRRLRSGGAARPRDMILRILPGNRRTHFVGSGTHSDVRSIVVGYNTSLPLQWVDYTDHVLEVLTDRYYFGGVQSRVAFLHVTPPMMLDVLTQHLLQKHIDPATFCISDIVLSGAFLSHQTRQLATQVWKARIHHSYSCSEIRGEAVATPRVRDAFEVLPTFHCEIVDVDTSEPVAPGEAGLVVCTSLHPFQRAMPFIRYVNGDIAQRCDDGECSAVTRLRPIGRLGECVRIGPRHFLGTRDGFATATFWPEIPQIPYPRFDLRLDVDNPSLLVFDVEVSFAGSAGFPSPEAVAARLSEEIRTYDYPSELLPERIVCRMLPKGSLVRYPRIVPDR